MGPCHGPLPPVGRGVLAGALAVPLLAACSACTGMPAGVDLQRGTCSCPVLARPESAVTAGPDRPPRLARDAPTSGGRLARLWRAADWPFTSVHVQRHVAARGLAVAPTDGGDFFWHAGRSGIDTSAMVPADLLPLLAGEGLATDRIALIGWSMGGYGALPMTSRLGPCPGGRRGRHQRSTVAVGRRQRPRRPRRGPGLCPQRRARQRHGQAGMPAGLDCGPDDPFMVANRAFARAVPSAAATFDPWAHPEQCWTAHAGAL